MKALVAGGAGFIGSHLCEALLKKGYEVVCLDNLITGSQENIRKFINNPKFSFIQEDITKKLKVKNEKLPARNATHSVAGGKVVVKSLKLEDINQIYHLASPASPRQYQKYPVETLLANSLGTYNLLELARKTGAKFLYASSSEVYGEPKEHPQKETYWGNVNPVGIRSCYDEGKRFGEALTMAYVRTYRLDGRIVRIFNTYGPKMEENDGRVISNFINQAIKDKPLTVYGDGGQTRSFCYITDMVKGLIRAMERPKTKGETLNIGNPDERSVLEIAELIKKMTKTKSKIIFTDLPEDDPTRRRPDISRAQKILHWQPQVKLEDGLRETIKYFKALQRCATTLAPIKGATT